MRAAKEPSSPENRSASVTLLLAPSASTQCPASRVTPGLCVTQTKLLGASNSVTCQTAGNNLGCRTWALLPTEKGPSSIRRTLVIVEVHSGQRSTSDNTSNTRPGDALMSTAILKSVTNREVIVVGL